MPVSSSQPRQRGQRSRRHQAIDDDDDDDDDDYDEEDNRDHADRNEGYDDRNPGVDDDGDDEEEDEEDEAEEDSDAEYVTLRPMDVAQGRSNDAYLHPGNVHYRRLVEKHYLEYSRVSHYKKHNITSKILDRVRKRGGRFVKPAKNVTDDKGQMLYVTIKNRAAASKTTT
jgi:hypothetical protein